MDDDDLVSATIKDALVAAGHDVASVPNGRSGLDRLAAIDFDLIVIDLVMPEVDGIEAIRQIRARDRATPIIAISGSSGAEIYLSAAQALGATTILRKPFANDRLVREIASALD
ncbi:MAG: response regulator [Kiloniellales bacterium]